MNTFKVYIDNIEKLGLHTFKFAGLSIYDLLSQCPRSKIISYPVGYKILSQRQPCENVYLILEGQVKLTRLNSQGKELITDVRYKSDFFGRTLTDQNKYFTDENAISITTTYLWKSYVNDFNDLIFHHPALSIEMIRMLSAREASLKMKFQYASQESVEIRLAHTLRELSGRFEEKCEHGYGKHIRISQQELADMVGSSRPTVSTLLNQLRSKGVLNYNRDYLCVQSIKSVLEMLDSIIN